MPGIERLLRFSQRNTLLLVLLSIIWSGLALWVYFSLPSSLLPNLNFPSLSIVVESQGLTAEELEKQVALPIESTMSGIYNVNRIRSASVSNLSLITVQLKWGANLELARNQVMQKLATIQGSLPSGSTVSLETLGNTLGQVESFVLSGGGSLTNLYNFVRYHLKPALLQQDGVFQVLIFGGQVAEYGVFISPSKLQKFDLTIKDLRDAAVRNNVASVGGVLDLGSQSFGIVPKTRFTTVDSIANTIVAVRNNVPVRFKDVASVRLTHLPFRGGAEHGEIPSVVVQIVKQPDADTVAVTKRVEAFMNGFKSSFPSGVAFTKYYDQSEVVLDAIRGVEEAVLLGAFLVGVILLIFLRSWRASLVAFTSIPTSLLSALIFMHFLGMSLNVMSLSALAIATGMVIDDAIVVIENFFRHRGLTPDDPISEVFVRAASEVAGPVVSSTVTTVAIFIPLAFLTGLAGRLFSPVGVIVSIVMSASLIFAFTLIPSVGSHLIRLEKPKGVWEALPRFYIRMLEHALKWRWWISVGVVALCAMSIFLLTRLNREFLPLLDEGSVLMIVEGPPSNSLNETLRTVHLLQKNVFYDPDISTIVSTVGHAPGMQDTDTMNHADVTAKLVSRHDRKKSIEDLFAIFRERVKAFPGVSINFTMPLQDKLNDAIGGVSATIGVKIFGDDLQKLQNLANETADQMNKIPGVVDLHPSSIVPVPSLDVSLIEDKANLFGVTREDLNDSVSAMSFGIQATQVRELYQEIPLMLRFEGTDDAIPTLHLQELKRVPVRTADGRYVPLSQVARVNFSEVPSRIDHEQATRLVTISCNVSGVSNQDVVKKVTEILASLHLPKGYHYEIGGSYAAQSEATQGISTIAIVAIILVTLILWMEFRSLKKTFLVLLTIPLSTIGASVALWVFHQTLNISTLIGLVMLVGVVLRNGIVLVDYIHYGIERGEPLKQAIEEGARVRLRPILMTALSEILGLSPLALGIGSGAALTRPLAIAVIGGLITSTFLTLFMLPIGYEILFSRTRTVTKIPAKP